MKKLLFDFLKIIFYFTLFLKIIFWNDDVLRIFKNHFLFLKIYQTAKQAVRMRLSMGDNFYCHSKSNSTKTLEQTSRSLISY